MNRFQREDPTFRLHVDEESEETIISGMGELHLEIYVERLRREYKVDCETGQPRVAYRETITRRADLRLPPQAADGRPRRLSRASWAAIEPNAGEPEGEHVRGRRSSAATSRTSTWAPAARASRRPARKGRCSATRSSACCMVVTDGATHVTDSSDYAFNLATQMAFRKAFKEAGGAVLEPMMKTTITAPNEFQGNILMLMNKRGTIVDTEIGADDFTIIADCSLELHVRLQLPPPRRYPGQGRV